MYFNNLQGIGGYGIDGSYMGCCDGGVINSPIPEPASVWLLMLGLCCLLLLRRKNVSFA